MNMKLSTFPSQPTSFVGRKQELTEINTLLNNPNCRLLTLVGPGGIGKTRLAIEAARHIDLPNGVYFVALQSLTSPDFILSTIAEVVDFQFYSDSDPKAQLLNYLSGK